MLGPLSDSAVGSGCTDYGVSDFGALEMLGSALDVPLWMLRLEKKTEILEAAGHATVASLLDEYRFGSLLNIPGIGQSTLDELTRRFSVLNAVASEGTGSGTIEWQRYALALGHELVPSSEVCSGPEFLASFTQVVDAVIRSHPNPVDQLILTERLVRQKEERLTLDQIGQRAVPKPITRERVRQLEKRLISALSDAILLDDYRELPFHFRSSFVARWKDAAQHFAGNTEISFGTFMVGLEKVWEVPFADLLPNLPLITSILTSKATLPPQLRRDMGLHPRLFGDINFGILKRPIGWLALGNAGSELTSSGVETISDLVAAARVNELPAQGKKAGALCRRALNALAEALGDEGQVNWCRFAQLSGLSQIPEADRVNAKQFLEHLNSDLENVVRLTGTSKRAADIFRLRTCVPPSTRLTLDEVARLLGGHGSTIKREETELLEALHRQLAARDYTFSRVLFPPQFRAWWRSALKIFASNHASYRGFSSALAAEWDVPLTLAEQHSEGLWAVFARYPTGHRLPARRQVEGSSPLHFAGGTIILRGFRGAH